MMPEAGRILVCLLLLFKWTQSQTEQKRKVCFGTSNGLSHTQDGDRYTRYRTHYSGCEVVEGNLEIVSLTNASVDYNLSFLRDIEEVTGYVLIFNCSARFVPLINLRIIRGKTTFRLETGEELAVFVVSNNGVDNGLQEIQLRSLTEISYGNVLIKDNSFLCHVDTIEWDQIFSRSDSTDSKATVESNAEQCTPCATGCMNKCWSAQANMCQKLTKNCPQLQCRNRCSDSLPVHCCHSECAAGCTGPTDTQCVACSNYLDEGRCVSSCPPQTIFNTKSEMHEINPNAKLKYRSQCVRTCPAHMIEELGACVVQCQSGHREGQDGGCVPCNGPCPKHCNGTGEEWISEDNIESFKDCVVVRGNIKIQQSTFAGSFEIHRLSALEHVKEITGYLSVDAYHRELTNLSFFRNLEIIKGQQLYKGKVALKVYGSSLVSLSLNSLREILEGDVLVKHNSKLCFVNFMNWRKFLHKRIQQSDVSHNRDPKSCASESLVCAAQCTDHDGCMGPGVDECLKCANFHYGRTCLESCSTIDDLALYLPDSSESRECAACHNQCLSGCSGPGADQCSKCKKFRGKTECIDACPQSQFPDEQRECKDCNEVCDKGCTGPGRNLGPGGCNSCHLFLLDSDGGRFLECLPKEELNNCFNQKNLSTGSGDGESLATCQKCYQFMESRNCVSQCSSGFYSNVKQRLCRKCHPLCSTCSGPMNSDCLSCSQFKVYDEFENRGIAAKFNCSSDCPSFVPQPIYEGHEGVCAPEGFKRYRGKQLAITIGLLVSGFAFLGIVVLLILIIRRQLAKTEEKKLRLTAKLTGIVECEPLTPSNTKPDMSVLRLIRESELKRGNIIGSGAFGTVYKGFWIPEEDKVKVPVAIKVLQEGSGQNESLLEEARIMASVDHPCCVRILAVCMTAQMMLITQLMPLGSLLEYIRKNRDNIGSKNLLNWSTQIAKGMAYLEERGIIHRDLAARNVLVQSSNHVKITDFGLAKMVNKEDRFQESGGKWPIKWLALESIQHQLFTHKSDVWSFGVTMWELCTYGQRPYDGISARNVVDLLEKGERLPQPSICTIDVYMIMIKCWMLDADSRPSFSGLSEELAKMARDPGRYLVVQNDSALKLASHPLTTKDLLKFMSLDSNEGCDNIISGDDYINNLNRRKSSLKLQNSKGKFFSKNESKTETTPLLRLNIPRRSTAQGTSDSGPESPRYSPDPSSLAHSIPFHKSRDSSSTGASIYRLPEKLQEPSPPPRAQPVGVESSDYLQPVISPPDHPAYLELEYDSVGSNPATKPPENANIDSVSEAKDLPRQQKRSLPPAITVTNPEYFNQVNG